MVNLLSLLANITVINKCKHILLYFFLISFFLNFQIFPETFRKLYCGNFPSFRKLSWKLPETSWKFATLSKIRHILPPILTRSLYLSLIEPYISYCNLVWSSSGKSQVLNRVLKIEKRYVRLISFSSYRAHSQPLFKKLNILTVYQNQLAIYMFRILNNLVPHLCHHHLCVMRAFTIITHDHIISMFHIAELV